MPCNLFKPLTRSLESRSRSVPDDVSCRTVGCLDTSRPSSVVNDVTLESCSSPGNNETFVVAFAADELNETELTCTKLTQLLDGSAS